MTSFSKSALVFSVLSVSLGAFAQRIDVSSNLPLNQGIVLNSPTTFVFDNPVGNIVVYEEQGSEVKISAKYRGDKNATVQIDQSESGKMKISVEYPNGGNSGNHIHIGGNGGSISIGGGMMNSVVITGGGSVVIDGQRITSSGSNSVSIGSSTVELRVGIPAKVLAHLKASSNSGDIEIKGTFQNDLSSSRQVALSTQSGDVECEGVCAIGNIGLDSQSGDITVSHTRGSVKARTQSGNVKAVGNVGQMSAQSMSGDISVSGQTGGNVTAKTLSGDVRFNNPDQTVIESGSSMSGSVRGSKAASSSSSGSNFQCKDLFKF